MFEEKKPIAKHYCDSTLNTPSQWEMVKFCKNCQSISNGSWCCCPTCGEINKWVLRSGKWHCPVYKKLSFLQSLLPIFYPPVIEKNGYWELKNE